MVKVFDFFSGCGGTSLGFQNFGFKIIGAMDFDKDSAATFIRNFPKAEFFLQDIRTVDVRELAPVIGDRNEPLLFCGCAPCQPFSQQKRKTSAPDDRKILLYEFLRFIEYWKPDFVFLENVPGLQNINRSGKLFKHFTDKLKELGYFIDMAVVKASDLGIPQVRKRFILTGCLDERNFRKIADIVALNKTPPKTVRECISDLPTIQAGEIHASIPNHAATKLSELNLQRIRCTPEGGDRRNWPKKLLLDCHENHLGHTDVYGRMKWDSPATTLTTKCTSYSNGRFGHPDQDRAISVREAARLQTFPDTFEFIGTLGSCSRQVGNAVPPLMAEKISQVFCLRQDVQ